MADELASLRIKVESLEAEVAGKRLDDLANKGGRAEKATDGLTSAFARFAGPAALAAAAIAGIGKVVEVTRQFGVLNAGLITATGSAERAAAAFGLLQNFAQTTPYSLDQAVDGFSKLVNLGLTPSEQALKSYGNTAAAMGKDLSQMIEAVADASTGEFERLKEFGIKAKQQGDEVSFTFQGTTTTVKKNSAEIEKYLIGIGENNFAGAMEERMKTLDGAISNLGDTWDGMFLRIGNSGMGDLIAEGVNQASAVIQDFSDWIGSGEPSANIVAYGDEWKDLYNDVAAIFNDMSDTFGVSAEDIKTVAADVFSFISDRLKYGPADFEMYVKVAVSYFSMLADKAKIYGGAVADALNPRNWLGNNIASEMEAQLAAADAQFGAKYDSIMAERAAKIDKFDRTVADNMAKTAQQNAERQKLAAQGLEGLAKDTKGDQDSGPSAADQKKADREAKAAERKRLQEEAAAKRKQEQEVKRAVEFSDRMQQLNESDLEKLTRVHKEQMEENQRFYDEHVLTESQYRENLMEIHRKYEEDKGALEREAADKKKDFEEQNQQAVYDFMSDGLDQTMQLLESAGKQQSGLYKALFAVQKAAAIPSIITSTMDAASKAAAMGGPFGGEAMAAAVTAAGMARVGIVAGQTLAGLFDKGGDIPAGQVGIVGEFGPEIVRGPANVTSRADTAALARGALQGGGQGVVIHQTFQINGNGDMQLQQMLKQAAADGARQGYDAVHRDFASNGNIRRTAGL